MQERGLKLTSTVCKIDIACVAPYAGAWIEILILNVCFVSVSVAPYAGAWIEIFGEFRICCGTGVAPYAGAWIEIKIRTIKLCLV